MAFEKVGVKAVIDGMHEFERDASNFNNRIGLMGRAAGLIQAPFSLAGNILGGLGGSILRVGEIAAGFVVANTFGRIADQIGQATSAAIQFGKESVMSAARVEELDVVLKLIGERAGYSSEWLDQQVDIMKDLGIETKVAQNLLIQFSRYDLKMADATKLARVAQDAAVISMQDSSEALDGLIHGITTMNTRVLRTYGITIASITDAQDDYAKSIGKTREQLTESELMQAALNKVLEQGTLIEGAYEAAMGTAGKQARSMARYIEELRNEIGKPFLKAFSSVIGKATEWIKSLRSAAEEGGALNKFLKIMAGVMESWLGRALDWIGDKLQFFLGLLKSFTFLVDQGYSPLQALGVMLKDFLPDWLWQTVSKLWEWFNKLLDLGPIISGWVAGPIGSFLAVLKDVWQIIQDLATGKTTIAELLPDWVIDLWDRLVGVFERFGEWWDRNGPAIGEFATRFFGTLGNLAKDLGERIGDFAIDSLEKFADWFDENEIEILMALQNFTYWFEDEFAPAVKNAWDKFIRPALDGLIELILNLGDVIIQVLQGDWKNAWEELKDAPETLFMETLPNILNGFADWVTTTFLGVKWQEVIDQWTKNMEMLGIIIGDIFGIEPGALMQSPKGGSDTGSLRNPIPNTPATQAHPANTYNNSYNLVVNTSAPSEPIISDFDMLANIGH